MEFRFVADQFDAEVAWAARGAGAGRSLDARDAPSGGEALGLVVALAFDLGPVARKRDPAGRWLGRRDHLVRWHKPARPDWMDQETYDALPDELELRRKTPAMARVEHDKQPYRISFKGALQTLNAFQPAFLLTSPCPDEIYRRLLKAIATHRVGDRPNRIEPRAKKRRKKNYPLLAQRRAEARKRFMITT